jgi:protein-tyrosine kinase
MNAIDEPLERADGLTAPVAPSPRDTAQMSSWPHLEPEMVRLHHLIDAQTGNGCRGSIQFIGSREFEGVSTIAREFARVSATQFGQHVLLLTFDPSPQDGRQAGAQADVAPSPVGDTTLSVGVVPREFIAPSRRTESWNVTAGWDRLRQVYDLIVIDSPSAATSPEGLALVDQVTGVVIVLEAETTRWPVAVRTKEEIVRSGGRVLGVVFNKRRHYIPAFLYRWL